jgi:group I intron endonuclease
MNVIYMIVNLMNNKRYIGQSTKLSLRWTKHRYMLNANIHPSKHLQAAWNKYGEKAFRFEILESNILLENLIEREKFYINLFKSNKREFGYNIRIASGSNAGIKYSSEIVEKNRLAHLGIKHTEGAKKKMSKASKGKPKSIEHRKNISIARKGKPNLKLRGRRLSDNALNAARLANLGRPAWNRGIPQSPEVKEKNRIAHLGKSPHNKGKKFGPMPEETKQKIREGVLKAIKEGHVRKYNK